MLSKIAADASEARTGLAGQGQSKQLGSEARLWRIAACLIASAWLDAAGAEGFCERPQAFDPDAFPGLFGEYELVGRAPGAEVAYLGRSHIAPGTHAYAVQRSLDGEWSEGEAWVEYCSADRYPVLMFSFDTPRGRLLGRCFARTSGDNYYLLSCYTRHPERVGAEGVEALFQLPGRE